jgi:hypothetical protein
MTIQEDALKKFVQYLMEKDLAYPVYKDGWSGVGLQPVFPFIVCLDYDKYIEKTGNKIESSKLICYHHPAYKKRERKDIVLWIPFAAAKQTTWEIVIGPDLIEYSDRSMKLLPEYTHNTEYIYQQFYKNEASDRVISKECKEKNTISALKEAFDKKEATRREPITKEDILNAIVEYMEKHSEWVNEHVQQTHPGQESVVFNIPIRNMSNEVPKAVWGAVTHELETLLDRRVHVSYYPDVRSLHLCISQKRKS